MSERYTEINYDWFVDKFVAKKQNKFLIIDTDDQDLFLKSAITIGRSVSDKLGKDFETKEQVIESILDFFSKFHEPVYDEDYYRQQLDFIKNHPVLIFPNVNILYSISSAISQEFKSLIEILNRMNIHLIFRAFQDTKNLAYSNFLLRARKIKDSDEILFEFYMKVRKGVFSYFVNPCLLKESSLVEDELELIVDGLEKHTNFDNLPGYEFKKKMNVTDDDVAHLERRGETIIVNDAKFLMISANRIMSIERKKRPFDLSYEALQKIRSENTITSENEENDTS